MIALREVTKRYAAGGWAVRGVTLEVGARELVVLLGESGSGKTTLLKMVNRLVAPDSGRVEVDGRDVMAQDPVTLRRGIGYVVQQGGLFPHLSVGDNVAVVPRLLGWTRPDIDARVDELLGLVGLAPETYRARRPAELSGGQRQRVGVARALAARPPILLMDEPFGALDALTREALQKEVLAIDRALGLTTLVVTHDLAEALTLADRIAVLKGGRLLQVGPPADLVARPADAYVAGLMGTAIAQAERVGAVVRAARAEAP